MIETSGKKLAGAIIRLHPNDNIVVARVDVRVVAEQLAHDLEVAVKAGGVQ